MFMSDPGIKFSKSIGWTKGPERTGRYAIVVDHRKVVYAENEPAGDVTVRCRKEWGVSDGVAADIDFLGLWG